MNLRTTLPPFFIAVIAFLQPVGCATKQSSVPAPTESTAVIEPQVAPLREPDPAWKCPPRNAAELTAAADLEALNKEFRATYARERAELLHTLKTVVVARFSCATLFLDGQPVVTERVIPSAYHNLRYAAHMPFTLYLKLSPVVDHPLEQTRLDDLRNLNELVKAARASVPGLPLTPVQQDRQRQLLDTTSGFVQAVLANGRVSRAELRGYAHAVSDAVRENTRDAACAQIDGLHAQLLTWRTAYPNADWAGLRVVVHGPQQARCDYVVTQYFAALFQDHGDNRGYPGESRRLVYCEDNSAPADGPPWGPDLTLLAAINLDADASEALFVDPDRLSVDVMADGPRSTCGPLTSAGFDSADRTRSFHAR